MEVGTKVKNESTGHFGVVVPDMMSTCGRDEIPVEYEGDSYSECPR